MSIAIVFPVYKNIPSIYAHEFYKAVHWIYTESKCQAVSSNRLLVLNTITDKSVATVQQSYGVEGYCIYKLNSAN
jgi:hypothetical protein